MVSQPAAEIDCEHGGGSARFADHLLPPKNAGGKKMSPTLLPGGWTLADPLWLLALLLIPLAVWWRGRRSRPVLVIPRVARWAGTPTISLGRGPSVLAGVGLALLIVGLARPQQLEEKNRFGKKGMTSCWRSTFPPACWRRITKDRRVELIECRQFSRSSRRSFQKGRPTESEW